MCLISLALNPHFRNVYRFYTIERIMTRRYKFILLFSVFIFSFYRLPAQSSLYGTVLDINSNETLVGVNVYLPEYSRGTVTGTDGQYFLKNLHPGIILVQYSMIGYKTEIRKIRLGNNEFVQNIEMEEAVIQGEEIVVTGGFHSSQHENVVKIRILKAREYDKTGTLSLIAALTKMPGVDMISKGPGVSTPVIRGLSLTNILFLNNGVRMENFQFSENHPFMVDEYGMKSIEVIKGPASLLYGSGAVGGVFNIIKEAPAPEGKITGDVNLKFHSNTVGILTNAGIKGTIKGLTWGIRGGINSNKDYLDGNKTFVPNSRFNRKSIKTDLGLIKRIGSFRISYDINKDNLGMTVEPAILLVDHNGRKNEVWYQDLTNHLISSKNKLFLGNYKLVLDIAYQMNNRKLKSSDQATYPELVDMDLNTLTYSSKINIPTDEKTKLIFGIQGMFQSNRNNEAPEHVIPNANINDFSLFGLGQHYHWNHLMIQAGIRYDYRSVHVPEQESGGHSHDGDSGHDNDSLIKLDRKFNNFSGSLGATLNLRDSIHFRLNFASAFRSPNLAELTQNGMHGTRFEQGNANLNSQWNIETDLSFHYHSLHLTFDLSGFYNNISNYIHLAPTTDTTDDGQSIYRYGQVNAFLYGGEALVHAHPRPVDWLHLRASLSYVIGKNCNGDYLPFIPATKFAMEVELQRRKWNIWRDLYFRTGIDYAFPQDHTSRFETSTEGYVLFNVGLGGNIISGNQLISLDLTANNLFNKTYYDHLSTLKPLGIYNMGRNISLSLKIPFSLRD